MNKCVEIVVTYNRKKLLEENLFALRKQTYEKHDILIIDNASTDGTQDMVLSIDDDRIMYYNTGENLGGAGGFAYGLKKAIEKGYHYAWIMDDDSVPEENALESLIYKADAIENNFSFMASLVYWTDGKLFDMNVPEYHYKEKLDINFDLIRKYKLVPVDTCSFVGCFINLQKTAISGLPISEFFIYGDDFEYTSRIRRIAPAYLDLDSIIIHKAPSNNGADIATADESRISRFYYQSRNGMYIARKNGTIKSRLRVVAGRIFRIIKKAPDHRTLRIWILIKGSVSGLFFNPRIQYVTNISDEHNNSGTGR